MYGNKGKAAKYYFFFWLKMRGDGNDMLYSRILRTKVKYPESGEVLFAFSGLNSGGAAKRFTPHFDDCDG